MKMKIDLHENKLVTLRQRELGNGLFSRETGTKMSSYVKQSLNFVTPACDYAFAVAPLKSRTQSNIKILARDECTALESFNIIK